MCACVFFKQKTAYALRISDWSSDVCSSDLAPAAPAPLILARALAVVRDQLAPLLAARHSTLMIDASIGGVMLAVDEEAMLVALRNLVENAAIYGPEGQRVTASFALTEIGRAHG